MRTRLVRHALGSVLLAAVIGFAGAAVAQQEQDLPSSELEPTDATGVPEEVPPEEWMEASGTVAVEDQTEEVDVLIVEAENLVPEGTYTVWWADNQAVLTPVVGLGTGPNDDLPENAFTADENGNAEVRILAATDPPYQHIVIALHTGEEVDDDEDLTESVYQHLEGPWPRS